MSSSTDQAPNAEKSRWSVGLLAAGVFLALVVLVGGIVVVSHDRGNQSNPSAAQPSPTSAPSAGTASGFADPQVDVFGRRIDIPNNPFGQPLDQIAPERKSGDPDWLTAAPAGLRGRGGWQRVSGVVVPFSTSDGPTRIQDGVPTGYAHTPQGAALAAVYVAWETVARPSDWPLRAKMVVTEPGDQDEFDRLKAEGRLPDRQPESVTRWMLAPDAFRITSWADDLCVLRLASRNAPDADGQPRWLSSQIAMIWDGTAWRMRLPEDKRLPQQTVYSLAGWTPW